MDNNDVLRRLRYIFDYRDDKMVVMFAHEDQRISLDQVGDWLKKDEAEGFVELPDLQLAAFLQGMINENRGVRDGPVPELPKRLDNNTVLRMLKIALELQSDDMVGLVESAGLRFSKHELSAFFRKKGNRQYRECNDQVLRNLLKGLQLKHRGGDAGRAAAAKDVEAKIEAKVEVQTDTKTEQPISSVWGQRKKR